MSDENKGQRGAAEARAQMYAAIPTALPGLLDAAERAERAERERDDLAATLETRNAEHALAMARVRELEAAVRHALPWVGHLPTAPDATEQMLAARRRLMVAIQGGDTAEVSRAE